MRHRLNKQPGQQRTLNQTGKGGIATLAVLLVVIAAAAGALSQRQAIFDWYKLRNYQAPATVAQLATQDTMTDYARHAFYVNHPDIAEKTAFRSQCPNNGGEQTIVLGCYKGPQNGIYLLNVTDTRLDGVVQVTAAHETLHAIYDRLSDSKRKQVDAMLLDYYHNHLTDQRIKGLIEGAYTKTEPNDLTNEMHSIFGTEIASLPAPLETYYKQYFTNRAQIAGYAAKYQAEFTSRQASVAQADTQLKSLKAQIETAEDSLKSQQSAIDTQRNQLTSLRDSGNTTGYNAGVPTYNNLVNTYNTNVANIKTLISTYNQLVESRNATAMEAGALASELDASSATTIEQ